VRPLHRRVLRHMLGAQVCRVWSCIAPDSRSYDLPEDRAFCLGCIQLGARI
jgi:hypothetical protein